MIDPFNAVNDDAERALADALNEVLRGEPNHLCLRAIARVLAEKDRPNGYELGDMLDVISQRARLYNVLAKTTAAQRRSSPSGGLKMEMPGESVSTPATYGTDTNASRTGEESGR